MESGQGKISEFILTEVEKHPAGIVARVAQEFGISRQRAHLLVAREVTAGRLIKEGRARWTRYFLARGKHIEFSEKIEPGLDEFLVWTKNLKQMISSYPENIKGIVSYGFTEIFNNAIDHSLGTRIFVDVSLDEKSLKITVMDNGVGIFKKIQTALDLESAREAILHLSKGKFTTDPSKHTGEGIFFTSRMFDSFSILSDDLFYTFSGRDWFLSSEKREGFGKGTLIEMSLSLTTQRTPKEIMDQYADQEICFGKTIVAVALSADPSDPHVSRSQAKRLLMGLEKFRQVVLDFKGIQTVGPSFVDEIFRVFQNEYPEIKIQYFNANEEVDAAIRRALANIRS